MLSKRILFSFIVISAFIVPVFSFAQPATTGGCDPTQGYCPLAPIPQIVDSGGHVDVTTFIPGAIKLGISIASALSVIFIIIGGVKYVTTDSFGGKSDAKDTIESAIMGLLLAIGSYAILFTINPSLVRFNLQLESVGRSNTLNSAGTDTGPVVGGTSTSTSGGSLPINNVACTNNCIALSGTGLRTKDNLNCDTEPCYLNSNLITKLQAVDQAMGNSGWQITEPFPPRAGHLDSCHKPGAMSGTCADIALTSDNSFQQIDRFLDAIKAQGLAVGYETSSTSTHARWMSEPMLSAHRANLQYNPAATGQHAHVELR